MFTKLNTQLFFGLSLIFFSLLFFQCGSEVTKEDVISKKEDIKEDLTQAKENIHEALSLKEKYIEQQKGKMISQLQERQLEIEVEIEKLEDMVNDSQSVADSEINAAIKKYRAELKKIDQKMDEIKNVAENNWKQTSVEFQTEIDNYQLTLEEFLQEVEALETLKADSL